MISKALYSLESAWGYVRNYPQIQFALLLVIVLPLAFLYSGNQFLEAGKANQNKLQRDRIGLLHDSFISLLRATDFDTVLVQNEIESIAVVNPDITKFRVVQQSGSDFTIVSALDSSLLNTTETEISIYQTAAVRFDESLIFPFEFRGERLWQAVRATQASDGSFYYVLTENSFATTDAYFASNERQAYYVLGFLYLFVLAIAYWHIRSTDYKLRYKEAQNAIKTKDLFTNMIAHELRAPLTAMQGYASMVIEADETTDTNRQYAERINSSSARLLTVVNDLLDVARIQSGKMSVEKSEADIATTVRAVVDELQASAVKKSITVTHNNADTPILVLIDQKRMHQALTNLVSNAIKYTKQGAIEIELIETAIKVELRVKDTGMGISAEDQKQLFAPFFRVQSDDVSQITGTGLGMWITRQLIELMGATIGVESIKGVGTHIVVTIPK